MNENRTAAMLQRVPVILAVTAGFYGLAFPAGRGNGNTPQAGGPGDRKAGGTPRPGTER